MIRAFILYNYGFFYHSSSKARVSNIRVNGPSRRDNQLIRRPPRKPLPLLIILYNPTRELGHSFGFQLGYRYNVIASNSFHNLVREGVKEPVGEKGLIGRLRNVYFLIPTQIEKESTYIVLNRGYLVLDGATF